MAVSSKEIEENLRISFPNAEIEIKDLVGDSNHYGLVIKDAGFNGKSLIAQHKMVKEALSELLKERLHAISIKTVAV